MEQVKSIFRNKLQKTGIALTVNQLWNYVKKTNITGVTKPEVAKFISQEPIISQFSKVIKKNKKYQTIGVLRPGVYFIDYAEYSKKLAPFNNGIAGFILAVENVTNKLFVIPTKTKNSSDWDKAVEQFINVTRNVSLIYSDRDAVATSEKFRSQILAKYKIE